MSGPLCRSPVTEFRELCIGEDADEDDRSHDREIQRAWNAEQLDKVLQDRQQDRPQHHKTRGLGSIDIASSYHSNWMDNSKAKFELHWRPRYDLNTLIESAWTYERPKDEPRKVWYPG